MPDLVSQPYRGESHHWADEDGQKVVVDLGETKGAGAAAAEFDPDIIILTHSDQDHIEGGTELFKKLPQRSGREMWVPHDWSLLLAAQQGLSLRDARILDEGSTVLSETMHKRLEEMIGARNLGNLYKDLTKKSARLKALINEARRHKVKVRYFSVDHPYPTWRTQGRPGVAILVNAAEKAAAKAAARGSVSLEEVLFLYALSIQNKRALVTYLWNSEDSLDPDGALIWSDTDGSHCGTGGQKWIPWKDLGVMTAPHHASATDCHQRIWDWRGTYRSDLPVVLAGGMKGQNEAVTNFLDGVAATDRGCTMCGVTRAKGAGYNRIVSASVASPWPNCGECGADQARPGGTEAGR